MLKKAGIVVAAAAAALLAVSPLAFAGDKGSHDHGGYDKGSYSHSEEVNNSEQINSIDDERNQVGLVNVNDNNVNVPIQACGVGQVNASTAASALNVLLGVLGSADLDNEAGDASATAECAQDANAGDLTGQLNSR